MHRLVDLFSRAIGALQPLAQQLGAPGLALVAFFDSSFLSLPEVADALLIVAVIHRPDFWPVYAVSTTLGSLAGCYALYSLARRGGDTLLRRRFNDRHIDRGLGLMRRYGLLTIIVPSILPPPAPFKIFVLLAGVAAMPARTFLLAVVVGRGFRYGSEAWLAYRYGDRAAGFIREHLAAISLWVVAIAAVIGVTLIALRFGRARATRRRRLSDAADQVDDAARGREERDEGRTGD
jgi:membrane protein YqaA with SNARE-associated domain